MGYYYIPYYLYSAFEWLLLVRALYSIYFIIISISSSNSSIIVIITFLSIKARLATPIICYLFTRNMRKTTNDLTHLSNTEISKVIATKLNNFKKMTEIFHESQHFRELLCDLHGDSFSFNIIGISESHWFIDDCFPAECP